MAFEIYLDFANGDAAKAMDLYEEVFSGQRHPSVMKYGEAEGMPIQPEEAEYILHAEMKLDNITLNFSDVPSFRSITKGNQVSILYTCKSSDEVESKFKQLSEGGEIDQAPSKTFFAEMYCAFTDRFGILWQLIYLGK